LGNFVGSGMENYGSVNKISKMADINWSDDDEVEVFFNDDNDTDNDFDGFGEDDILLRNANIVMDLPMDDFIPANDHNLPVDLENGWKKVDSPPVTAPFMGNSKLNIEMDKSDPRQTIYQPTVGEQNGVQSLLPK
jgi:hypothetical protein